MRGYPGNGKKVILIIFDLVFGIYLLNSKIAFLGSISLPASADNIAVILGGFLFLANFIYLIFFTRRVRLV